MGHRLVLAVKGSIGASGDKIYEKWQVIRSLQYSNRAVIRKAPVYVDSVFWAGMS